MTAITPGSGGTLRSTTAEGALFEAAMYLQNLEADVAHNPNNKNYCNVVINTDTKTANVTATLPLQLVQNSAGGFGVFVLEYLS